MPAKIRLSGMTVAAALLVLLGSGCAEAPLQQPQKTDYMKTQVGTTNELSPLAPVGGCDVRKVGNKWACDLNGQTLIYKDADSLLEQKAVTKN